MSLGRLLAGLGGLALAGGCSFGPGLGDAGFDAPDQGARLHAVAETARGERGPELARLIEELESDDPATRMLAIRCLERVTGKTLGFAFDGDPPGRLAAVQRWRAWLADQRPVSVAEPSPGGAAASTR